MRHNKIFYNRPRTQRSFQECTTYISITTSTSNIREMGFNKTSSFDLKRAWPF